MNDKTGYESLDAQARDTLIGFASWFYEKRGILISEFDIYEYLGSPEDKIYLLRLNDMRSPKVEMANNITWSYSREDLEKLLEEEHVDYYSDDGSHDIVHYSDAMAQAAGGIVKEHRKEYSWGKTYRKGGPLEWYNEPSETFQQGIIEIEASQQELASAGIPHISEFKNVQSNSEQH